MSTHSPLKWSRSVVSDSLRPPGLQPTRLLHPWDFPGKNTGVGCHFFLQGIFPTQGLNLDLPHCRQTLYCLSLAAKARQVQTQDLNPTGWISLISSPPLFLFLCFVQTSLPQVPHTHSHFSDFVHTVPPAGNTLFLLTPTSSWESIFCLSQPRPNSSSEPSLNIHSSLTLFSSVFKSSHTWNWHPKIENAVLLFHRS